MPPSDKSNKPKRSIDGVRRSAAASKPGSKPKADYRPDHELPAPVPEPLIEDQGNDMLLESGQDKKKSALGLKKRRHWRWWATAIGGAILVALVVLAASAFAWYQRELSPVTSDTSRHIRVTIESGETPDAIASQLQSAGVIRSSIAFTIYTKLTNTQNNLKAGAYSLQPSLSTPAIVDHLVTGKQDTFRVTFLPGDTLANGRKALLSLGIYSTSDVDAALGKTYGGPLFATKPAGTDLEGYLYGETIEFDPSATVETILQSFFDQYEAFLSQRHIVAGFKKQGLTLYQGITLASIVQREVSGSDAGAASNDQRQVARVFLNRLAAGMTLGSDVTAYYGADRIGAAHSVSVDTPYNTRIHPGLPPGPIATPGNGALLAVANPAHNDYLFFLSGDDGKMHYATTDDQHQQNIASYCQKKCATP